MPSASHVASAVPAPAALNFRRDGQRRLVIGAAERRAIEQIQPAVVAGGRHEILVLVADDDRRRVEVGALGGEPVLRRQRLAIERDDRVRVGGRGPSPTQRPARGAAPCPGRRRACRRFRARAPTCRRCWPRRSSTTRPCVRPRRQSDPAPRRHSGRRRSRPTCSRTRRRRRRSARTASALGGRNGVGGSASDAVARAQRVQVAVAADDVDGIDAAERNRRRRGVAPRGLRPAAARQSRRPRAPVPRAICASTAAPRPVRRPRCRSVRRAPPPPPRQTPTAPAPCAASASQQAPGTGPASSGEARRSSAV